MGKAYAVIEEIIDPNGREIKPEEFKWLVDYFSDPYDPRLLSIALGFTTGLRSHDFIHAKISWFTPDFQNMKMSECKVHKENKDGLIRAKVRTRYDPIVGWLAKRLRDYVSYRLSVGFYVGKDIKSGRLFPTLKHTQIRQLFQKLRKRYGKKEPWLLDLWKKQTWYDIEGNVIGNKKWYRVASHGCRANYCSAAWEVANYDIAKAKKITGHQDNRNFEVYIRSKGIMESKHEINKRFMDNLLKPMEIPITKDQTFLRNF